MSMRIRLSEAFIASTFACFTALALLRPSEFADHLVKVASISVLLIFATIALDPRSSSRWSSSVIVASAFVVQLFNPGWGFEVANALEGVSQNHLAVRQNFDTVLPIGVGLCAGFVVRRFEDRRTRSEGQVLGM